jgi:hypothetical protein
MIAKLISVSIIAALSAALFILVVESSPTTVELDADIAALQNKISDAKKKSDAFSGGLIKSLVEVRIEILASTEAMLAAKKESIVRRLNLQFQINGSEFKSTSDLESIRADIAAAQGRVAAAEAEAAKYTGGLLQVLQLTKAATEDISVAQLNSAFYSAKYGLPPIGAFMPKNDSANKKAVPVGNVVKDKDAL